MRETQNTWFEGLFCVENVVLYIALYQTCLIIYQIFEQMVHFVFYTHLYLLNKILLDNIYRILDYAFSCTFVLYVKLFVYIVIFIFCVSVDCDILYGPINPPPI